MSINACQQRSHFSVDGANQYFTFYFAISLLWYDKSTLSKVKLPFCITRRRQGKFLIGKPLWRGRFFPFTTPCRYANSIEILQIYSFQCFKFRYCLNIYLCCCTIFEQCSSTTLVTSILADLKDFSDLMCFFCSSIWILHAFYAHGTWIRCIES